MDEIMARKEDLKQRLLHLEQSSHEEKTSLQKQNEKLQQFIKDQCREQQEILGKFQLKGQDLEALKNHMKEKESEIKTL